MRKSPKKVSQILKNTDNSREYRLLKGSLVSGCPICSPHKGCNRRVRRRNNDNRSWKNYRKHQWKENE